MYYINNTDLLITSKELYATFVQKLGSIFSFYIKEVYTFFKAWLLWIIYYFL